MPSFRLDEQNWIPVVGCDGTTRTINLVEIFTNASEIVEIQGTPLEHAAITRFLLAIAHLTETPNSLEHWNKLWSDRKEFMRRCGNYVKVQGEAWDLFHDRSPFGQIPDLEKTSNPAHILVYESARMNNAVFADHSIKSSPLPVPAAKLARGLITTNAYSGSSGGGYRCGPLAMRTVAMLSGQTLEETLLLNLFVQKNQPTAYDWNTYGHENEAPKALNIVQRYLWASRKVRLIPNATGTAAETMMLAPGNKMDESEQKEDPMIVMRKDYAGKEYIPLRLEPNHAVWRSADVLLNWHEDIRHLAIMDQLQKLLRRKFIDGKQAVSMRVCSVGGDAQGPSTQLWREEKLPFGYSVITEENRFSDLVKAVEAAANAEGDARRQLRSFAVKYLQNGSASSVDKNDVGKLCSELTRDFSGFWERISPMGEQIACDTFDEKKWHELLKSAKSATIREAIERLTPDARRLRAEYQNSLENKSQAKKQKKGETQ